MFCVHIDDKTKNVRYGLLGISFDSKKAEIGSIIDNLPDTSYLYNIPKSAWRKKVSVTSRVSVQGVKSLGGHFACLCRRFEFYEVKTKKKIVIIFQKEN